MQFWAEKNSWQNNFTYYSLNRIVWTAISTRAWINGARAAKRTMAKINENDNYYYYSTLLRNNGRCERVRAVRSRSGDDAKEKKWIKLFENLRSAAIIHAIVMCCDVFPSRRMDHGVQCEHSHHCVWSATIFTWIDPAPKRENLHTYFFIVSRCVKQLKMGAIQIRVNQLLIIRLHTGENRKMRQRQSQREGQNWCWLISFLKWTTPKIYKWTNAYCASANCS